MVLCLGDCIASIIDSVSVSSSEEMGGYGVISNSIVKTGETIFRIPKHLLINSESAKNSEIGYVFKEMEEIGICSVMTRNEHVARIR